MIKNMKIAVLGTRGFPQIQGGIEAHCENLYTRLAALGCDVAVFTRRPYVIYSGAAFKGVKLIPLPCPKQKIFEAFVHTLRGLFYAKRVKPDIVHFHAVGPSFFIPLARFMGFKVVMTHHGPDYKRKKWGLVAKVFLVIGEYLGIRSANEVIAISGVIAEDILKKCGRKAHIIPNGAITSGSLSTDGTLKKFGLEKGKYILSVGRFVPEKGFHDLIVAFIKSQAAAWKLVIVGDADHEDKYSRELKRMAGGSNGVVMTGSLTGQPLQELYSHAGLFVLPSYYEGLPIALLEALSYGLSCLASDISANRSINLAAGRFFKAGDVRELTEKILYFINNPLKTEEKTAQIKEIFEKYSWDDIANKTLEVYKMVCHGI